MMLTESNPGTWTVGIRTAPCGLEAYCPDRVAGKEEEVFPFVTRGLVTCVVAEAPA
jgi:hypothetical protein